MNVDQWWYIKSNKRKESLPLTTFFNPSTLVALKPWENSFEEVVALSLVKGDSSLGSVTLKNSFKTIGNPLFLDLCTLLFPRMLDG